MSNLLLENAAPLTRGVEKPKPNFFSAKAPSNNEAEYSKRGTFFSDFWAKKLYPLFNKIWKLDGTQKTLAEAGLTTLTASLGENGYQGSTAQNVCIYLFDLLGIDPKGRTLEDAYTEMNARLKQGIPKKQVQDFLKERQTPVDRPWNQMMRAIVFVDAMFKHLNAPENLQTQE